MNFKERLFELLNENNLWFAELSRKTGISKTRISSYIAGISYPTPQNLVILSDYFNISSDYLLGISDIKNIGNYTTADINGFYIRYKELLKQTNTSNRGFLKEAKIDKSSSFLWSNGTIPQTNILIKLSILFGCSVDFLLGRQLRRSSHDKV